jgi:maleate isomerase
MAGSSIALALERELGVPVLDSVRVAIEHSLELLQPPGSKAAPGRLGDA